MIVKGSGKYQHVAHMIIRLSLISDNLASVIEFEVDILNCGVHVNRIALWLIIVATRLVMLL